MPIVPLGDLKESDVVEAADLFETEGFCVELAHPAKIVDSKRDFTKCFDGGQYGVSLTQGADSGDGR